MSSFCGLTGIVSHPRVYDAVQAVVGQKVILHRVAEYLADVTSGTVLDVGAGTGAARSTLSQNVTYLWLDNDTQKLQGYRRGGLQGTAILGDATCIPLAADSVDTAVCMFMTHHLSDEGLVAMLEELHRVVRHRLIVIDAVCCPSRIRSRLLWAFDRGSYPREQPALRACIGRFFSVESEKTVDVIHRYFLCTAIPH